MKKAQFASPYKKKKNDSQSWDEKKAQLAELGRKKSTKALASLGQRKAQLHKYSQKLALFIAFL